MNARQVPAGDGRRGFTLIELLVVIAIITLLIGILLPSLGRARDQSKNVKTRATMDAMGKGLEMFRGENEEECRRTGGYPPSAAAEDPTEPGAQLIFGGQWAVRYLLGKDLKGYVPKRNVPPKLIKPDADDPYAQEKWYSEQEALDRVGPYIQADALSLTLPKDLPGKPASAAGCDPLTFEQPVAVDAFGMPILYYAANVRVAARPNAAVASYDGTKPGIYTMKDNALFTGLAKGSYEYQPWDLAELLGGGGDSAANPQYKLARFGSHDPPTWDHIADDPHTFPYYVLNKNAYEASGRKTAIPYRKDAFLLIAPGKDKVFGTGDDVTNFE